MLLCIHVPYMCLRRRHEGAAVMFIVAVVARQTRSHSVMWQHVLLC
jgi:hypothetical protein